MQNQKEGNGRNQRVGGKGINVRPTHTSNMQSHMRRAVMQQAVKQSADISSISTYKLNENMTIKMNNNKDNILKNDQDNITSKRINTKTNKIYNNMSIHVKVSRIIMAISKSIC